MFAEFLRSRDDTSPGTQSGKCLEVILEIMWRAYYYHALVSAGRRKYARDWSFTISVYSPDEAALATAGRLSQTLTPQLRFERLSWILTEKSVWQADLYKISRIVCYFLAQPTHLETIYVLSDVSRIWVVPSSPRKHLGNPSPRKTSADASF